MDNRDNSLFSLDCAQAVYESAASAIDEYGMSDQLRSGVLVGLSGGADSVMLLHFLIEYRKRNFDFPIIAVHVNHNIRGDEAKRDAEFARELADSLGVEFILSSVDVPVMAKELSIGVEEAARDARYSEFARILSGRNDISAIAVAHNSTDNLETVLFNIMRGAGARGAAGIPPVRDNIIRPLINVSKGDICKLLNEAEVEYVTDSTNLSTDYTRNFLRHSVIESLRSVFDSPEDSASRLSRNLRCDDDCLYDIAHQYIAQHPTICDKDLAQLHDAVFARVIILLAHNHNCSVEYTHIRSIREHIGSGDFSISLPSGMRFVCERGSCSIQDDKRESRCDDTFLLTDGRIDISGYDADLYVVDGDKKEISRNVYKFSIQASLSSAIIVGMLHVRFKRDGDTVFYGGHTHKLKKVFCDLKIPKSKRDLIPLLCDDNGVVWAPGLAVRDDSPDPADKNSLSAILCIGKGDILSEKRAYAISEFRINTKNKENNN